jgi:hypothetical protein
MSDTPLAASTVFCADPEQIPAGGTAILSWKAPGAVSVALDGQPVEASGRLAVQPRQTTVFSLIARGPDGAAESSQVTVAVKPAEIAAFRAMPESAPPDGVVELSWQTRYAESCALEPGNISVPIVGQYVVQVKETTTYTLAARGEGTQASASVTVTADQRQAPADSRITAAADKTVFDYAVSPDSVYVTRDPFNPSIAKLDIGVSNNTGGDAACEWISFVLRIGATGSDLTQDASISTSVSQPDKWSIAPIPGAPGQFRAAPVPPNTGLKARESVSFRLDDIDVNQEPGATKVRIVELVDEPLEYSKFINKIRADLDIKYFQASPPSIEPGRSSTLSWKTEAAAGCTLNWPGGSPKEVAVTGETDVQPPETAIYTLTARGGLGPNISKQTAVVVKKVDVRLEARPLTVGLGGSSVLIWKILYADPGTCRLDPGNIEIDPEGQKLVALKQSTTYAVSARGGTSSDYKQVTISVVPPVIHSFSATTPAKPGDPVTLTWKTDYAESVIIDQGVGGVDPSGSTVVSNVNQTTYTLTCFGLGEPVTARVTVPGHSVRILAFYPQCIDNSFACNNLFFGVKYTCMWTSEFATSARLVRVKDGTVVATRSGEFIYYTWAPAHAPEDDFRLILEGPGGPVERVKKFGWSNTE